MCGYPHVAYQGKTSGSSAADVLYEERYFTFCDEQLIGGEFHYILDCKNFKDLRSEYIPEYFWKYPNKQKLITLLNSKDKKLIHKICNFVKNVLKKN